MAKIDASRASNEELRKANERSTEERGPITQQRARPSPFSLAIMDVVIPASLIMPKIVFIGAEVPEAHLTTFNSQRMISGGTNAMHCKMFMGTFIGTTLQWFVSLPDGHITSFDQFLDCSGNNSLLTKLNRLSLSTFSV